MSVAAAVDFLRKAREDAALRARIEALPETGFVAALFEAMPELDFTPAEFDRAFEIDWYARWLRFGFRGGEVR
ncbi:MAG: hypothetical protein J7483_07125 [Novosphingobium sp.]|nr:hypothetical protein [Novosphingobium sp.]